MALDPLYPLRFLPIYKRLLWGGRRLETVLGKPLPDNSPDYAESWELVDLGEDVSAVAEGPLQGVSLHSLLETDREAILGPGVATSAGSFPLLVKLLDAHQVLSIQVHPDDRTAQAMGLSCGKTEAWVVMEAQPGSRIYAGLRPGVTRASLGQAMAAGRVAEMLHHFEPVAGDVVFIPAGTVHAIGAGVLLAEIQQPSGTTFRLDDWNRLGPDRLPRALHHAEALESIHFERGPVNPIVPIVEPHASGRCESLIDCPFFVIERLELDAPITLEAGDRFTILLGLEGSARVASVAEPVRLRRGETLLLPAGLGGFTIEPQRPATLLTCRPPG